MRKQLWGIQCGFTDRLPSSIILYNRTPVILADSDPDTIGNSGISKERRSEQKLRRIAKHRCDRPEHYAGADLRQHDELRNRQLPVQLDNAYIGQHILHKCKLCHKWGDILGLHACLITAYRRNSNYRLQPDSDSGLELQLQEP